MTTSLELSKKLAEAGLEIETEKWWVEYPDGRTNILSTLEKQVLELSIRQSLLLEGEKERTFAQNTHIHPAFSTDELLAVMPVCPDNYSWLTIRKLHNTFSVSYMKDEGYKVYFEELELSEAIGKMCLYLLGNGWRYSEKEKCLIK